MRPFASFDSIAGYLGAAKKTGVCSVDINVQKQAAAISSDLARIEVEEFEKAANEQMKTL